jgi:hypothetical protein
MRNKTLDSHIRDLRSQGKIPKIWSPSNLMAFLEGLFSRRTLSVYPNNYSVSPDGLVQGDAIKRGMPAKYIRLGQARFVLIEEYSDKVLHSIKGEPVYKQHPGETPRKNPPGYPMTPGAGSRNHPFEKRARLFEKRLLEIFPTKEVLMRYARLCVEEYRPNSDSFKYYHSLIDRHRKSGITILLSDPGFLGHIYETLKKWDMNYRNAKLIELSDFSESIKGLSKKIIELADYSMGDIGEDRIHEIEPRMRFVFENLKVMQSQSGIVGVPKTLHFLLPRLVMPIDGKYTLNFFFGYRPYRKSLSWEYGLFLEIFEAFSKLAIRMGLSRSDEEPHGWNTTVPKIIDNAIIGYMRQHKR